MVSAVSGATSGNLIGKEWESAYWSREIITGLDKSEHVHSLTAVVIPLLGEATIPPSNESISSLNDEHSMPASIIYLSRIWKFYLWSLPTNLHIFQTYNEVAACSIDKYRIWLVWGDFLLKKKVSFFFFLNLHWQKYSTYLYVLEWIPNLLNHAGKNICMGRIYHCEHTYQIIFECSVLLEWLEMAPTVCHSDFLEEKCDLH